jgi:hypothetical protein
MLQASAYKIMPQKYCLLFYLKKKKCQNVYLTILRQFP